MKLANLLVKFHHENNTTAPREEDIHGVMTHPKSFTECSLMDERMENPIVGTAVLHEGDNFCKETGRKISLGRALRAMGLPKEERAQVWEAYRTSAPKPRWNKR